MSDTAEAVSLSLCCHLVLKLMSYTQWRTSVMMSLTPDVIILNQLQEVMKSCLSAFSES